MAHEYRKHRTAHHEKPSYETTPWLGTACLFPCTKPTKAASAEREAHAAERKHRTYQQCPDKAIRHPKYRDPTKHKSKNNHQSSIENEQDPH